MHSTGDIVKIDFSILRVKDDKVHVLQIYNLLKTKYTDAMANVTNCCVGSKGIDLEAMKDNAIWNVEPRLVVVDSIDNRSVAKSIAQDVLKESFISDQIEADNIEREINGQTKQIKNQNGSDDEVISDINGSSTEAANENCNKGTNTRGKINWNDIQ